MSDDVSFRGLGFLSAFPGREYHIGAEPGGLLRLQVVALRLLGDDIIEAANANALRLTADFDDTHPDFVLLETVDDRDDVLRFALALDGLRYHRVTPKVATPALPVAAAPEQRESEAEAEAEPEAQEPSAEVWHDPKYPPPVDWDSLPDPMTDQDMARFLRRNNRQFVQRLRLDGRLAFTPGRPPTVTKADFLNCLEGLKVQVVVKDRKLLAAEARQTAREKANAEARAWAIEMLNRPKRAKRGKSA